ncbi:hypothetical protein SDC49_20050 [Lactobacillus sp. R2/2]|nr:hypothetical protein [Lactobacillus sp. R2/2]
MKNIFSLLLTWIIAVSGVEPDYNHYCNSGVYTLGKIMLLVYRRRGRNSYQELS